MRGDFITESEKRDFCDNCCEICSRHCVIWRKAEEREDEHENKAEGHKGVQGNVAVRAGREERRKPESYSGIRTGLQKHSKSAACHGGKIGGCVGL